MNAEDWKTKATELSTRVWYGNGRPIKNLFTRVLALVGDAEIRWCGGDLVESGDNILSGRVYFYTDDLLVIGRLTDFPSTGASGAVHRDSYAQLRVIPRSNLVQAELPEVHEDNKGINRTEVWAYSHQGWPEEGAVVLHYEGLDDPITLTPRMMGEFEAAVPSIVADVGRR